MGDLIFCEIRNKFINSILSVGNVNTRNSFKLPSIKEKNLIKGNYTFARFISGNETYTQPSIMYLPRFGWVNLASEELKEFYYPLLPMIGPNFDEQTLFYSYSVLADSEGEEEKFCYELDVYDCNATLTQKESHCISSSEMVEIFTEMMLPYYGR
jgi:hypothetical protein